MALDFNQVAPRLYQGGRVDPSHRYDGFTMIVLCAEEFQPPLQSFRGTVLRPAFDDTLQPTRRTLEAAYTTARDVAKELQRGGRVLVTCAAGLNRSGLVTGLALCFATSMPPETIVRRIRQARGAFALSNKTFERLVTKGRELEQRPKCLGFYG